MSNLHYILLSAEGVADTSAQNPNVWNTVIQYCIYGAIIVVSIFLLILLNKHSRLPRHGELKKKLTALLNEINSISAGEKRVDFFKSISRAMYKADNLSYTAAMMAEKERYADLGKISTYIDEARTELSPYKYGKKEPEDDEGIRAAAAKTEQAIAVLDGVIARDNKMKRK